VQQLQAGLKAGIFFQGKLSISSHSLFDGSIHAVVDEKDQTIQIIGRKNMNRAVNEDIVVVQLLPKTEWKVIQENMTINEGSEF
jgi:exosome complex exonuclease DIS3/RRP44